MEFDGETVRQILIASLASAAFVAALVVASQAFGANPVVTTAATGDLEGTLSDGAPAEGPVTDHFTGNLSADVNDDGNNDGQETVNGTVTGTVEDGRLTGRINGTIQGTVDGRINGTINGTVENGTFEGNFDGMINGTDRSTDISETGGLALVGLLGGFILAMALAGFWLERQEFDSA